MTVVRCLALLAILLTATVGIIAAHSTPEQEVTKEKSSLNTKEAKNSDKNQGAADKVTPPVATQISAHVPNTPTPKSSEDIEIQRKLVNCTLWLVAVGALQVLALIVQAFLFWYTLHEVRVQANLMRKHSEHLQDLATAASDNAKAARENAGALINSERAWVLVTMGKLPEFKPDPTMVSFVWIAPILTNHGKTPARITRIVMRNHHVVARADGMAHDVPGELPPVPEYPVGQSVILEGKRIVVPPGVPQQPAMVGMAASDFIAINEGRSWLYIYGCIDYLDTISGLPHQTKFCFLYWIPRGISPGEPGWVVAGITPAAYIDAT